MVAPPVNELRLDVQSVARLRQQARRRSLIVPGGGLCLMGYRGIGLVIGLPLAAAIVSLGWLAIAPRPLALWTFLCSAGLALCGSLVESLALRRIPPRCGNAANARGAWFTLIWITLALGVLVNGWLIFRYVGWFKLRDAGMDPTVRADDYLLFSRFGADGELSRGTVVAFQTPENSPIESENGLALGRIVAVADDELSLSTDGRRYVVNGEDTGLPAAHLAGDTVFDVPRVPRSVTISFKEYFISADNPRLGYDGRSFGLVPKERIVSARLLRFGRGAFGMALSESDREATPATPPANAGSDAPQRINPQGRELTKHMRDAVGRGARYLLDQQAEDGAWRSPTYGSFKDGASLTPLLALAIGESAAVGEASGGASAKAQVQEAGQYVASLIDQHGGAEQAAATSTYPLYTTALAVSLLGRPEFANDERLRAPREAWLRHLRALQLSKDLGWQEDDPFYGGWGYSTDLPRKPSPSQPPRQLDEPNLSATVFALEALRAAGVSAEDAAIVAARRFVERCQNFARDEQADHAPHLDGGFFFIQQDPDRNKAGTVAGTAGDAPPQYRSYGSATADGLRCLVLCGAGQDDPRVAAAVKWLASRFDPARQPGDFPADKQNWRDALYYYYTQSLARTLITLEQPTRMEVDSFSDWRTRLSEAILARQADDGSWVNRLNENREDDPLLATALALRTLAACHVRPGNGP